MVRFFSEQEEPQQKKRTPQEEEEPQEPLKEPLFFSLSGSCGVVLLFRGVLFFCSETNHLSGY